MATVDFLERLEERGIYASAVDVPVMGPTLNLIAEAYSAIMDVTDGDWCCDDDECSDENPICRTAKARGVARKLLNDVLVPQGRPIHPDRLGNPAEKIFVDRWQKEAKPESWKSNYRGLLELILAPTRDQKQDGLKPIGSYEFVPLVSQRDADVAVSVIQWLGTNCGRAFIEECEREITQANVERRAWESEEHRAKWQKDKARVLPEHVNAAMLALEKIGIRSDHVNYERSRDILAAEIAIMVSERRFEGV